MRQTWLILALGSVATLSACADAPHQTAATAPTVTYTYNDNDDPDDVTETAAAYCDETYGKNAVMLERSLQGDRFEATYACQ